MSKRKERKIARQRKAELEAGEVTPMAVGVVGKFKVLMHPDCELPEGISMDEILGIIAENLGEKKEDSGTN